MRGRWLLLGVVVALAAAPLAVFAARDTQEDATPVDPRPAVAREAASRAGDESGQVIPGRYIVALKKGASPVSAVLRHRLRPHTAYRRALNGFAVELSEPALARLRADRDVALIEPDRIASVDVQTLPAGIDRIDADLNSMAQIDGIDDPLDVDIAIIDTGIQNHLDLRVAGGVRFIGTDCAGGSYADDRGHGTHVAGIAAAIDNSLGVVGVAPGARLWAVKVLNSAGSGSLSCIIAAVDWVTANAGVIEAANISIRTSPSSALCSAIAASAAAGVVYAVSAGNQASDASTQSPANCPDVLTTSAIADFDGSAGGLSSQTYPVSCGLARDDQFACFSNYGPLVEVAAPGVGVYSTYVGGGYATISGTSMASPHAAGAAALDILEHGKPTDAAGAAAVRDRIVAGGAAQSGAFGFTGDPDSYPEPLLHVRSEGVQDVELAAVILPDTVFQEDAISVQVTVGRQGSGNQSVTIEVTATAGVILDSPETVTLIGDTWTTVTFTWDTTGIPLGPQSVTATVAPVEGEANLNNNSASAATTVVVAHDIAVTDISVPAAILPGISTPVEVSVSNSGSYAEQFLVSLSADDGTVAGSPQEVALDPGTSATVSFSWLSPEGLATATLTATAGPVAGEGYLGNNTRVAQVEVRAPVLTVNSTEDSDDGVCDASHCTLREAITWANATFGRETISFDIPPGAPITIGPSSPLPDITDTTVIDGTSQPGYADEPVIELDLSGVAPTATNGLTIRADNSAVRGLVINRYRLSGVALNGTDGSAIQGNFIGTDRTGTIALNQDVGTGMRLTSSSNNLIGGTEPGEANVISGNAVYGISITSGSTGNVVRGNYIGVARDGSTELANGYSGVHIQDSSGNMIGGAETDAGNVIVGVSEDISIEGASASGNVIKGNHIRVTADGTSAICCSSSGIEISRSPDTVIGGAEPGAGNVISGHYGSAIVVEWWPSPPPPLATGTVIQGNFLGVSSSGAPLLAHSSLANGQGVSVNLSDARIGGTSPGAGNVIAYNGVGVWVIAAANRVSIQGNSIYSNRDLGIDLWTDASSSGVTANDPGDTDAGSNNLQNYPLLESAVSNGVSVTVSGTLNSSPNASFTLEFFASSACDRSGYGEGESFIGRTGVTTDGAGNVAFSETLPVAVASGSATSATATDLDGNTSEFSECVIATPIPTPTPTPMPTPTPVPPPNDDDRDGYWNSDETAKGSDPVDAASTPERCDALDNDGDTVLDEAPTLSGRATPDPACAAGADPDGDTVMNAADTDDDDDGFTDANEQYVSTDELDDCRVAAGHDAWPPDANADGTANVGDVIVLFGGGKVLQDVGDPFYSRRSDANGNGQVNVGDVIGLFGGGIILTNC